MAPTFKEQMESDLAVFFNTEEFGQAAIFSPAVGAQKDCTIVLEAGDGLEMTAIGDTPGAVGRISAKVSEVETPDPGDYFTITETLEAWRVVRVVRRDSQVVTLEVARETRMGVAR